MSLDVSLIVKVDTGADEPHVVELFDGNVTHNLNEMAKEAGVYKHLWRPDEIGVTTAGQLIGPLRDALTDMRARPAHFKAFNPPNGWGTYEGLVQFIAEYLSACEQHPKSLISTCR